MACGGIYLVRAWVDTQAYYAVVFFVWTYYCAWDAVTHADKNKQQLGLQEFLFDISMLCSKKQKIDKQKYFEQATTHSQLAMK